MDVSKFCADAYLAACKYYRYIESRQSESRKDPYKSIPGCSNHRVSNLRRLNDSSADFLCNVEGRIFDVDACEVCFRGEAKESIEIVKYSIRRRQAVLRIPVEFIADNAPLRDEDFLIVSDLKFLIRRLGVYYREKSDFFSFSPPRPEHLSPHGYYCSITLTEEQNRAVEGALSNRVSYIWGPPGTGKTRAVLSECVLRYIAARKRILLLAPTNNSVEQMLRGILPVLKNAGVDLTCVYRVGTASTEFAVEYPEVVGDSYLEKELDDLESQKSDLLADLAFSREAEQQMQAALSRLEAARSLLPLLHQYYLRQAARNDLEKKCTSCMSDLASVRTSLNAFSKKSAPIVKQLEQYVSELRDLFLSLKSMSPYSSSRYACIIRITELLEQKEDLQAALGRIESDCASLLDEEACLSSLISSYTEQSEAILGELLDIQQRLLSALDLPSGAEALFGDLSSLDEASALSRYEEILATFEADLFPAVSVRPSQDILSELQAVEDEIKELSSSQKIIQRKKALVIASTIDSILKSLPPEKESPYHHVFLDEAGYTSLIRGCVLFSCNCPVTFLGDHYQLAPICEMRNGTKDKSLPDILEDKKEVSLFSVPCAYFSELVRLSMDEFYALYARMNCGRRSEDIPPCFEASLLPMYPLSVSYRFHESLAQILSKYVYGGIPFHGASPEPFEIKILDAPNPNKAWCVYSSYADIRAISAFLNGTTDSYSDDVAILAPYNDQVTALRKDIRIPFERITTVHRAQGMEFSTVILSVVDTFRTKFVTNTESIEGRRVLNTAISRTKKRLVIACDVKQWQNREDQLISALISLAFLSADVALSPAQTPASAPAPRPASLLEAARTPE